MDGGWLVIILMVAMSFFGIREGIASSKRERLEKEERQRRQLAQEEEMSKRRKAIGALLTSIEAQLDDDNLSVAEKIRILATNFNDSDICRMIDLDSGPRALLEEIGASTGTVGLQHLIFELTAAEKQQFGIISFGNDELGGGDWNSNDLLLGKRSYISLGALFDRGLAKGAVNSGEAHAQLTKSGRSIRAFLRCFGSKAMPLSGMGSASGTYSFRLNVGDLAESFLQLTEPQCTNQNQSNGLPDTAGVGVLEGETSGQALFRRLMARAVPHRPTDLVTFAAVPSGSYRVKMIAKELQKAEYGIFLAFKFRIDSVIQFSVEDPTCTVPGVGAVIFLEIKWDTEDWHSDLAKIGDAIFGTQQSQKNMEAFLDYPCDNEPRLITVSRDIKIVAGGVSTPFNKLVSFS